jgi:hypothetical protein
MWRDYYEHRYVRLFHRLYSLSRHQYGFSPWDSLRVAWYSAGAARTFQPTRSRSEAQRALTQLQKYYGIVRAHSREQFDVFEAARLELEWWQLRRENATPVQYGDIVAQTSAAVFGMNNMEIRQAGRTRAEMMRYRDERHGGHMRDADWKHIEQGLARSYHLLKTGINRP